MQYNAVICCVFFNVPCSAEGAPPKGVSSHQCHCLVGIKSKLRGKEICHSFNQIDYVEDNNRSNDAFAPV